jgi:hypothetical protein
VSTIGRRRVPFPAICVYSAGRRFDVGRDRRSLRGRRTSASNCVARKQRRSRAALASSRKCERGAQDGDGKTLDGSVAGRADCGL